MNRTEFFDGLPPMPQHELQKVQWAYSIAKRWHEGQVRDGGERYFEHPRRVTRILLRYGFTDYVELVLGQLHDIEEDTWIPPSMLRHLFGPLIARGVQALSKSFGVEDPVSGFLIRGEKRTNEEFYAGLRRFATTISVKVVVVKCADRIDNLGDLVGEQPEGSRWTREKRLQQVAETREWVIPLAKDFVPVMVAELEQLCDMIEANVRLEMARAGNGA